MKNTNKIKQLNSNFRTLHSGKPLGTSGEKTKAQQIDNENGILNLE